MPNKMQRLTGRRVAVGALQALALLLLHLTAVNAATTLRLVQVVHRHGSRSAIVSYNETDICGDVPCGYLNVEGQRMMVNAGAFLRKRYNEDASVVSEPFLPSESYNLDVSYSRSTDRLRTLQSSDGLLRGLFPNDSAFFPAVHTLLRANDTLLRSDTIPYVFLMKENAKERNAVCNPWVDAVMDLETLKAVAKEAFSEGYCADTSKRCDCATQLYDIGAALAADGRIVNFPLLKAMLEPLRKVTEKYNRFVLGYDASKDVDAKMGSKGQPLARQILANAQLHMKGTSTFKLYHYSAHDSTLSPLAATLRDNSSLAVLPPFAQLYAFELLYDDAINAYSMRVLRGHPGQTPDTGFAFNWEPDFQLECMNSNNHLYKAQNNTCPYDDFQRLVDSTKPKDPAGLCYLDAKFLKLLKCPTKESEALEKSCTKFRNVCPAWACASGYTLDPVSLRCKCSDISCMAMATVGIDESGDGKRVSAIVTAVIVVGAVVTGCVSGLLIVALYIGRKYALDKPESVTEGRKVLGSAEL